MAHTAPRHVFRWDLDKTYLRTDFETLRGMLRSAFEKASDKRAVPGAPALLRALRAAGGPAHRICIISGSPRQMQAVLAKKLELDGVEYDEFVLKPNLQNFMRGRFRALRSQVPYKLPALLESRVLAAAPGETLFGDDAESDAIIYSLYADVVAGRVGADELQRVLEAARAYDDQIEHTLALARSVDKGEVVKHILIHLDKRSPTAGFERFGERLVAVFNYFQAALVLYAGQLLAASDVLRVAREMLASGEYTLPALANSLQNLLRRGRVRVDVAVKLALDCQALAGQDPAAWAGLPPQEEIAWTFAARVKALGEHVDEAPYCAPGVPRLDYAALVAEERGRKAKRRSW